MPQFKPLAWKRDSREFERAFAGIPEFGIGVKYVISQDGDEYRADCYTETSVFKTEAVHYHSMLEAKAFCEFHYQMSMQTLFNAMRARIEEGWFGALISGEEET